MDALHVITSLFDLAQREGSQRASIVEYVQLGRPLIARLVASCHVTVFTDPALVDLVADLGHGSPRLHVVPYQLEDAAAYADLERVTEARRRFPLQPCNAIKDTPLYHVFQRVKLSLISRASALAAHVAWLDFGIGKVAHVGEIATAIEAVPQLDHVQICHHYPLAMPSDMQVLRQNVAAGFIAGPAVLLGEYAQACEQLMIELLDRGQTPHDEVVLEAVAVQRPDLVTPRQIRFHTTMFHDVVERPLLGLAMIVKNEAHGIEETLQSFAPIIDRWTILDTGSTDGTQEIIRRVLGHIPGQLHEEPFVDFSTSRNRVLDLHGESTTFVVMPDSDDRLVNASMLRTFCALRRDASSPVDEAYNLNLRRGSLSYYLPLVMRTVAKWRYTGRVHEFAGRPGAPPASIRVPDVVLTQEWRAQSAEASRARWQRDLELLQIDMLADPRNSRTVFYLAQTYECLGQPEEALLAYERRIRLGGWPEETFEAMLRKAKILKATRPWADAERAFLDAYAFDPKRAEPLYCIAEYYYSKDNHALTHLFASHVNTLPLPATALFVDPEIYTWKAADLTAISAFYIAQRTGNAALHVDGKHAAERAIRNNPHDGRLRLNWSFYAQPAGTMFPGYVELPIDFTPALPYRAMNPSILFDGDRWLCVVRTVNYHIVDGNYLTPDDNVIFTRNYMVELARDDLRVLRATEMIDRDPMPRSTFPVHGFEDCRLFRRNGKLYCTSTACDLNDEHGNREIVLLELADDYSITKATPLRGPWSGAHQKNWMPAAAGSYVHFVYAADKNTVFAWDGRSIDTRGTQDFMFGRLRGGSQAIPLRGGGWLFLAHDVVFDGRSRVYLHRFGLMNESWKLEALSDPFYFQKRGIEFCAGLAYDGERLVASFAVNDESAHLGVFSLGAVRDALRRDFVV